MSVKVYDSVAGAWSFVENHARERENDAQRDARTRMAGAGLRPCFAAQAAFIASHARSMRAQSVILMGGAPIVEAIYMLDAMDGEGQITLMDTDLDVIDLATSLLRPLESRSTTKLRIIGTSADVYLPRLNSSDYDLVVASGDPISYKAAYDAAGRILRRGGELMFTDVMALLQEDSKGGVPNAADRSGKTAFMRSLIKAMEEDKRFDTTLTAVGTGMLLSVLR